MSHTRTRTYSEKVTCTRKFTFDAGHRVLGHEGKCRHIHGHTYTAEITVTAGELNALGMVVDFAILRQQVGLWIEDNLDHNFICHHDDPLLKLGRLMNSQGIWRDIFAPFDGRAPYIMPGDANPTAENIAKVLYQVTQSLMRDDLIVPVNVRVWETPNCFADYSQHEE